MAEQCSDVVVAQQRKQRPTAKGLGITTEKPKFPQYALVSKRHESYEELDWPSSSPIAIEHLVEAGLVFTGVGDSVRCYHCGGGLRNWETGDNPMVEHARWYPNCPHVILAKGQLFIQAIADGKLPEDGEENETLKIPEEDPYILERPAALAVMEMKYTGDAVRKAIHIFQKRNGNANYKASDLCEILFDLEENPECEVGHEDTVDSTRKEDIDCEESIEDLTEENDALRQNHMCKICLDKLADVIFLPCGHIVSCAQCAPALNKCPICRKVVNGLVKAFFAVASKSFERIK